jgi:hypothetical protein
MSNRQEEIAKKKPSRVSNGRRDVLTVRGLKDQDQFHYHWFNDINDNISRRQEEGYVFVDKFGKSVGDTTVDSARGTDSLMKKSVGLGTIAYLMKIPLDIYQEYKAEEQRERVDEIEAEMKRSSREAGRYGTIEINRK